MTPTTRLFLTAIISVPPKAEPKAGGGVYPTTCVSRRLMHGSVRDRREPRKEFEMFTQVVG